MLSSEASESAMGTPTQRQLMLVAFHASVPMVAFGFADNVIMLNVGEMIDLSLGVTFGLSSLTAAACGQCVSDFSGVFFSNIVDAAVAKLDLPRHHLSEMQLDMKPCRMARTLGSCLGVLTGCLLGMSILLFKDTTAAERMKRANELTSIFQSVMNDGHKLVHAERATLWLVDGETGELWSKVATGEKDEIRVRGNQGLVGWAVQHGEPVEVADAYQDERFNPDVDKKTGFRTRSCIVMPIKTSEEKVIGAIQIINKNPEEHEGHFTEADLQMALMLSKHVATFIEVVEGR